MFRYLDANTYTDYKTKRAAVHAMLLQNGGEVWTTDGAHLVAWLTEDHLHTVDLRNGHTVITKKPVVRR